jgi:uncharacterized protein
MAKIFLTAEWRNLLMANYEVDPAILKRYLPCYTELDSYHGKYYVSLVGFLFKNTKIKGIGFPFHKTFEEVNLRFYVRYKENNTWKRGVVFIKEIVPRSMITFVANTLYKENYATHAMRHEWNYSEDKLSIAYYWKVEKEWNYIKALADAHPTPLIKDSEEEFITEHFWGYTFMSNTCSGEYEVAHPSWRIHKINEYDIKCNAKKLYGQEFVEALNQKPSSVFLAEGSPIKVMKGTKILSQI